MSRPEKLNIDNFTNDQITLEILPISYQRLIKAYRDMQKQKGKDSVFYISRVDLMENYKVNSAWLARGRNFLEKRGFIKTFEGPGKRKFTQVLRDLPK